MKRLYFVLSIVMLSVALCSCSGRANDLPIKTSEPVKSHAEGNTINLALSESVYHSGLITYLAPSYERNGYKTQTSSQNTLAIVADFKEGLYDCAIIASKSDADRLVSDGFAVSSTEFMKDYYIIVGPADDPAGIADCENAQDALRKIAYSLSPFVSRADSSDLCALEKELWSELGMTPDPDKDSWYIESELGIGKYLKTAVDKQAYTITDIGYFYSGNYNDSLKPLVTSAPDLLNTYYIVVANPDKCGDVNVNRATQFSDWLSSSNASKLIENFGMSKFGVEFYKAIRAK